MGEHDYNSTIDNIGNRNSNISDTSEYVFERNESMLMEVDLYIENYDIGIKICFLVIGCISAFCSTIAITALQRTKRIPDNSKFLSTALLVFDSVFITLSTTRKFVLDPAYNTNLNVLTTAFVQLAYLTVGMMAFERMFVFLRPMTYMRVATRRRVKIIAGIAWTAMVTTFHTVRYGVCYAIFRSETVFIKAGQCNQIVTIYYAGLVVDVLGSSMVCYSTIFMIVKQKSNATSKPISFNSTFSAIGRFRTTSLVLVYILVILVTSIAYMLILIYIRWKNLGITALRMSLEVITIINCIFDPFLYVLWFRECRMELLKMLVPFNRNLQKRIDFMKIDIFNIVVTQTSYTSMSSLQDIPGTKEIV